MDINKELWRTKDTSTAMYQVLDVNFKLVTSKEVTTHQCGVGFTDSLRRSPSLLINQEYVHFGCNMLLDSIVHPVENTTPLVCLL